MLCNTHFKIRSNEGCVIDLLMPAENVIVDIRNDLGTQETIEVDLTTIELLECGNFFTTGIIASNNVDNFLKNMKYLQCAHIIPNVPDQFNLIKLKEDWLRQNIPNPLAKIDKYTGVLSLTSQLYQDYPKYKLSVRKTLYAPKTKSHPINIDSVLPIVQTLLAYLGIQNTAEQGVLVAGGSIFCSLFSQKISDYDLFFYGYDENEALTLINNIISGPNVTNVIRTAYTITIEVHHTRIKIQFILRLYRSIPQILLGFDLDCSRIGCDGQTIWITESALFSLKNSINIVDFDRMGTAYEYRLAKYARRNIAVYVPQLDYAQIRHEKIANVVNKQRYVDEKLPHQIYSYKLTGLSRLIYLIHTGSGGSSGLSDQKDFTYGPTLTSDEFVEMKNIGDVVEFTPGYTATIIYLEPAVLVHYQTYDGRRMERVLDRKTRKASSVYIDGPMMLDYLTAFCKDAIFPQMIEFKTINPGEQTPGSFSPISYFSPNQWYIGYLYHELTDDE